MANFYIYFVGILLCDFSGKFAAEYKFFITDNVAGSDPTPEKVTVSARELSDKTIQTETKIPEFIEMLKAKKKWPETAKAMYINKGKAENVHTLGTFGKNGNEELTIEFVDDASAKYGYPTRSWGSPKLTKINTDKFKPQDGEKPVRVPEPSTTSIGESTAPAGACNQFTQVDWTDGDVQKVERKVQQMKQEALNNPKKMQKMAVGRDLALKKVYESYLQKRSYDSNKNWVKLPTMGTAQMLSEDHQKCYGEFTAKLKELDFPGKAKLQAMLALLQSYSVFLLPHTAPFSKLHEHHDLRQPQDSDSDDDY